jgi:hypothetical protein
LSCLLSRNSKTIWCFITNCWSSFLSFNFIFWRSVTDILRENVQSQKKSTMMIKIEWNLFEFLESSAFYAWSL